jgi:streptogramin lyase
MSVLVLVSGLAKKVYRTRISLAKFVFKKSKKRFLVYLLLFGLLAGTSLNFRLGHLTILAQVPTSTVNQPQSDNWLADPKANALVKKLNRLKLTDSSGAIRPATDRTPLNNALPNYCNNPILTYSLGERPNSLVVDSQNSRFVSNNGLLDTGTMNYKKATLNKNTGNQITQFGDPNLEPGELVIDGQDNLYTIAYQPKNAIVKIQPDQTTTTIFSYPIDQTPLKIAASPTGHLFVLVKTSDTTLNLDKIDSEGQRTLLSGLAMPSLSQELVVDGRGFVWFNTSIAKSGQITDRINFFDWQTNQLVGGIDSEEVLQLVLGDKQDIYTLTLTKNVESIYRVSLTNNQASIQKIASVPTARVLFKILVNPGSGDLYGLDFYNAEIVKLESNTSTFQPLTKTSPAPTNFTLDKNGELIFSSTTDNTIRQVDCRTFLIPQLFNLNMVTGGGCQESVAGLPINCRLKLNTAGLLVSLGALTPQLEIEGTNSVDKTTTCLLDTLVSLKCDSLPTTRIENSGFYNLILRLGAEQISAGTTWIMGRFQNWTSDGNGTSTVRPEIVSFNKLLILTVKGNDNRIYTRTSTDGFTWSDWQVDPISYTELPVTMAVLNGVVYQSAVGTEHKIYTRFSTNGLDWSDWSQTGGTTSQPVAMASFQNKLFQAVKGDDDRIYTRTSTDGATWSDWIADPVGRTTVAVNLSASDNLLFQFARGNDQLVYSRYTLDGVEWSKWVNIGGRTNLPISSAEFNFTSNDRSIKFPTLTYVGLNGSILFRYKTEVGWTSPINFGGFTNNAVSSTNLNGKIYQAVTGRDGLIYLRSIN